MRLTIAKKLWLSFGILILVLGISGSISYLQIQKLNDALRLFMVVQEPLEEALLEMEVNIGESAIAIFGFVRDGNPAHIENLHHFQGIIEEDLTEFNSLATTKAEKEFGQKTNAFFLKHKALSQNIITLAGAMQHEQAHYTKLADQVNVLIDLSLSGASDKSDLRTTLQREAALLMKISFHRLFAAIEGYVIQRTPMMKKEISAAEDAFLKWNRIYAGSGLSQASKASLSELDELYRQTNASGNELVRLADQLQSRVEWFEKDLLTIRQILNDDIQPLLRRETERTAENALQSGTVALSVTLAMTLFALMATGTATWIITKGIIHSVRQLKEGSKAFGQGNLDHNIEVKSDDELKEVAIAFNRMAEKRKNAEKQLQESADKIKLFSYSISHDLKSPAIGIHGLAILLLKQSEQRLDNKGKQTCEQIVKTSALIEELVNNINAFISSKEAPLNLEKVRIEEILDTIKEEFSLRLEARGIKWVQPEHLPEIKADRLSIQRVIRNLVDNSLKYGGKELSSIIIEHEETTEFQILSLTDDGVGLEGDNLEGIFEVFKRKKTSQGTQGTGLGLAIVKEIMARHGGKIRVKQGEGKGITFSCSISKSL